MALTGQMCQARWVSGWWSVAAGGVVSRRLTRTHFEVVGLKRSVTQGKEQATKPVHQ